MQDFHQDVVIQALHENLVALVHFRSILVVYKKMLTALFNLVRNTQKS